jgi:hypothetical protein
VHPIRLLKLATMLTTAFAVAACATPAVESASANQASSAKATKKDDEPSFTGTRLPRKYSPEPGARSVAKEDWQQYDKSGVITVTPPGS